MALLQFGFILWWIYFFNEVNHHCLTHWGRDKMSDMFVDDIFKFIFFNENIWISLKTSLKFVPKVQNNNIPALVQIMAWCRPGNKPLSEPMMQTMMVSLLTHIWVTQPLGVKAMTCCLFGNKPLAKQTLSGHFETKSIKLSKMWMKNSKIKFSFKEKQLKMSSEKCRPFCSDLKSV